MSKEKINELLYNLVKKRVEIATRELIEEAKIKLVESVDKIVADTMIETSLIESVTDMSLNFHVHIKDK